MFSGDVKNRGDSLGDPRNFFRYCQLLLVLIFKQCGWSYIHFFQCDISSVNVSCRMNAISLFMA